MDVQIIWDEEPGGNVEHVAEHGVTPEEADEVILANYRRATTSQTTGRPVVFGWTSTGKHILVAFDRVSNHPPTVYPRTAYEVPPPSKPKTRRRKR